MKSLVKTQMLILIDYLKLEYKMKFVIVSQRSLQTNSSTFVEINQLNLKSAGKIGAFALIGHHKVIYQILLIATNRPSVR